MLTQQDLQQLAQRGISEEQLLHQLQQIKEGFPYLRIEAAARVGRGIVSPTVAERQHYIEVWKKYLSEGHQIVKFVPASGAASRMFKDLFAFLSADYDQPTTAFEHEFFDNIKKFAFRKQLCKKCVENEGKHIHELLPAGEYKAIVRNLLNKEGLNYGQLPKGLLTFHEYADSVRTAMEEHLVEAAQYAASDGQANIHFTVSHEHLPLFRAKVEERVAAFAKEYGLKYNISFSEQKPATDTVAANPDGTPFRNDDGSILFRPGGHGALIENLGEIAADVVFIKNIDNVVPDHLKAPTTEYKQVIAGMLVELQAQTFAYLRLLQKRECTHAQLVEMLHFLESKLCCLNAEAENFDDEDLEAYLIQKLNRPMRVCGVVKNAGEPGGGPFLAYNADGTISLQILESSQIDKSNEEYMRMFREGTHFNPVDLVCATKDYEGHAFPLKDYVDPQTGFISQKSKNGRDLLALELPGLWNGAMSDWNTVFVEVPLETFNPVKTVNDLLRPQHQPE